MNHIQSLVFLARNLLLIATSEKDKYERQGRHTYTSPALGSNVYLRQQKLREKMLVALSADLMHFENPALAQTAMSLAAALVRYCDYELIGDKQLILSSNDQVFYSFHEKAWLIDDPAHSLSTWGHDVLEALREQQALKLIGTTGSLTTAGSGKQKLCDLSNPVCLALLAILEKMRDQTFAELGITAGSDQEPATQVIFMGKEWGDKKPLNQWKWEMLTQRVRMTHEFITGILLFDGHIPTTTRLSSLRFERGQVFGEMQLPQQLKPVLQAVS